MAGSCVKCARLLDPVWVSSDRTIGRLLNRLAEALPPGKGESEEFYAFRAHLESRERAGRSIFGMQYLDRSNTTEALEEAVDFALYMFLDSLQEVRNNGSDEDMDLVLIGAHHAFQCYEVARHLRARRHGAP